MREELERLNEWWFTGKVRKDLALPFKRHAFSRIIESLRERQIAIITGLRRVGKTTLLYQTIEKALETESPDKILYFSFEESSATPKEVLEFYEKRILKKPFEEVDKAFIFFDEIQYARDWPSTLKRFYDLYPNLKFFVSGSSSLLLSREAMEKLAGRFFFFELKPLAFLEFLEMRGIKGDLEISERRAEAYFLDYLRKSGFPEIVDWENEVKIAEYVRNSVVDRVVLRDLPLIFRVRDIVLLDKIIKFILSTPGAIVNTNSLSKSWEVSKITISNYLKFLETSLLIRSLANFRPSFLSSSRKLKKYYPATPSLIFSYSKEFFERNIGFVLETYVMNVVDAKYYFREGKKEIDVILKNGEILPIEVKENVSEEDVKKFAGLINYIKAKRGVIVSLSQSLKKGNVDVFPAFLIEKFLANNLQNIKMDD
ncbi:MAG: ATP-binding protein [Candidatus Brockarchaeota archaeon]|nr:ATP-binding protein [Candidatus Brockarchaeota archaeon]